MTGAVEQPAAAEAFKVGDFGFTVPENWRLMPPSSSVRRAELLVPNRAGGQDGIVVFYHFAAGIGGGSDSNISRWLGSFREPSEALNPTTERRANGARRLTYFRASGTLIGADGDLPDYALYAVMLEGPAGNVFLRFAAPARLAAASEAAFRRMFEKAFGP